MKRKKRKSPIKTKASGTNEAAAPVSGPIPGTLVVVSQASSSAMAASAMQYRRTVADRPGRDSASNSPNIAAAQRSNGC